MAKNAATSGVDENGLRWEDVPFGGTTYRLREITVEEGDMAFDAAYNPEKDTVNPRLRTRLEICSSLVSPAGLTVDDIGKWGKIKWLTLLTVYERLNALPAADNEGNASGPTA